MILDLLIGAAGVFVVAGTLGSAVRAVVVPRAIPARISRRVFLALRLIFRLRMRAKPYETRDRIMAHYAPYALLSLLTTWLFLIFAGYVAIYWAQGIRPLRDAILLSGSSLLTLGFAPSGDLPATATTFSEAAMGLVILALLITYLPSIYGSYSRREHDVSLLEVRAGYPASAVTFMERIHRIRGLDTLTDTWTRWERWFTEVEEATTSFPVLAFFRSQLPHQSWITSAGVVLDAASIAASTLDMPRNPDSELCIRAGYVGLRRIAEFFRIPFDPDPKPDDPISITRMEYDTLYDRLKAEGLPLRADRDQAWRDFAGWRVNYDTVLVELCALVMAPPASWSSDRLEIAGRKPGPGDHRYIGRGGRIRGPRPVV